MMQDWCVSKVFVDMAKAWNAKPRYISSCGGTRSGKTFSNLQLLYIIAAKHKLTISIVSESMPHLKRGCIRDFKTLMGSYFNEEAWNKTDCIYSLPNGSIMEFFSVDSAAKVHGSARDVLFVNESQNIPYETARQLFIRTRQRIILDYNPTSSFWVNERIEPREDCITLHSTYLDNCDAETGKPFLPPEQIAEIESNRNDENWWRVYGLGLQGKLEGVIFDFEQVDGLPDVGIDTYGMDFGFTNDPTALLHLKVDTSRKAIYADELCYQKGMLNADIAQLMRSEGISRTAPVFCDCAEPKTIAELHTYGYNTKPCYKAVKKAEQLQELRGWKLYVTKRSLNLIRELRGYIWAKDKDGKPLNEPIAINDHAMDAFRYGAFTWITNGQNKGKYCIS